MKEVVVFLGLCIGGVLRKAYKGKGRLGLNFRPRVLPGLNQCNAFCVRGCLVPEVLGEEDATALSFFQLTS